MKRIFMILTAAAMMLATAGDANAQFGKNLLNKAKEAATNAVNGNSGSTSSSSSSSSSSSTQQNAQTSSSNSARPNSAKGTTYYVSVTIGGARNDGKSPSTPLKDLQKAIDLAQDNDVILVAEGNYLGNLDRGYIEIGRFGNSSTERGKFLSLYGGYSPDFTERDVIKHITKFQPKEQKFIAPLFNWNARRAYGYTGPDGDVVIDGFVFDLGENNLYCVKNVNDPVTSTPNDGVLTGRFIGLGESPTCAKEGYHNGDQYALHMDVEGNVKIANCIFVNCRDFGIAALVGKGHVEVYNNIFIACRYASCQIKGNVRDADIDKVSLDFHHNTVLFSWTRTKVLDEMGQGFRFMNGIRTIDVHNNIFGCSSNCGVERVYYETNKQMEALKQSNLYNNYFFANKRDLEIASAGVASISVSADRIEEAEQIGPKYEGNKELPSSESAFVDAIDQSYLKGFLSLQIMASQSYNANSAANQVNRAFGLNQQGTEIVRPTMYCNKYPWEKAKDLFGKVNGYGAQKPDNKMVK